MNTWNDIYDFSEKVLSYILRKKEEEYIQPDQDSPVEKMADKLGNSETLAERLQQQYCYDPVRAYRKLKNYRRRRPPLWCGGWNFIGFRTRMGMVSPG